MRRNRTSTLYRLGGSRCACLSRMHNLLILGALYTTAAGGYCEIEVGRLYKIPVINHSLLAIFPDIMDVIVHLTDDTGFTFEAGITMPFPQFSGYRLLDWLRCHSRYPRLACKLQDQTATVQPVQCAHRTCSLKSLN